PFPVPRPDDLIEVLRSRPDAAEPDLVLLFSHLLQLHTSGEVEQVRMGAGRRSFAVGSGGSPVENEPGRLDAGLRVFFRGVQIANSDDLFGQHEWFPKPSDSAISIIRVNLTETSSG